MPAFLRQGALFCGVQILVALALASWVWPPPATYLTGARAKRARLHESVPERPRILLVGGSSVAFGVDSGALAQAFPGYAPLNLGLDVRLGLGFILAQAERGVRAGDVVLLSVEEALWVDPRPERVLLDLLTQVPEAAIDVPWQDWPRISDMALAQVGGVARGAISRSWPRWWPPPPFARIYGSPEVYDAWGDMLAHRSHPPDPGRVTRYVALVNRVFARAGPDAQGIARVAAWVADGADRFRSRGARVAYIAAPLADTVDRRLDPLWTAAETALAERNVPVLLGVAEERYPLDELFDTHNHLRWAAAQARTGRLIERLRAWMENRFSQP